MLSKVRECVETFKREEEVRFQRVFFGEIQAAFLMGKGLQLRVKLTQLPQNFVFFEFLCAIFAQLSLDFVGFKSLEFNKVKQRIFRRLSEETKAVI